MNFSTKYSLQKTPPEVNKGPSHVEKAGYIPAQARIENMMLAGQRLVAHRAEMYDFKELKDIDENFIDPTRSKNFDMADATQIALNIEQKQRELDALKASQTAQDGSNDSQIPPDKGSDSKSNSVPE